MRTSTKLGLLGALYLSQGLPYGFFTQALPALLRTMGLSLPDIGLTSLLALPWALKFLWAPWVDRWQLPGLGRRRSWILVIQMITALGMVGLALLRPESQLPLLMGAFLLTNLLAATQDIATDGLAVELLSPAERGLGNGVQVAGYRVGMILGGGALLVVFDKLGWQATFLGMALMLAVAAIPIGLFREPPSAPTSATSVTPQSWRGALGGFVSRPGAWAWLGVVMAYKAGESLGGAMLKPMLVDLGLGLTELGALTGTAGFSAGLVGALIGGAAVSRFGAGVSLVVFGVLQSLTVAAYAVVPPLGVAALGLPIYVLTVLEHLCGGMATAALFTRMMDACAAETEGTDYTVQASAVVIATGGAATLSGFVAENLGYSGHFLLSGLLSLAAVGLIGLAKPPSAPASQPAA
ncbi:MFS transporter [Myxococcota bacterium]|nr:MFS transporter [Myxococcota bacterium]